MPPRYASSLQDLDAVSVCFKPVGGGCLKGMPVRGMYSRNYDYSRKSDKVGNLTIAGNPARCGMCRNCGPLFVFGRYGSGMPF